MSAKWKILWILGAVAIGGVVVSLIGKSRPGPRQLPLKERAYTARVIKAPAVDMNPRVLAYGTAMPGHVWPAVAQLSGRIVEKHPRLKKGALLNKGITLARVDPTDYQAAVSQCRANIMSIKAQIKELAANERNFKASLQLEKATLEIVERDLKRSKNLFKKKISSKQALDNQERSAIKQRQAVQNIQNSLNLIPAKTESLLAKLNMAETDLEKAYVQLKRTYITMPFDGRVASINIEESQFVRQGERLLTIDSVDMAEITIQIPMVKMLQLFNTRNRMSTEQMLKDREACRKKLKAFVRLRSGAYNVEWEAQVSRMSDTIDPKSQTLGIIVKVDNPYGQAVPGVRPPLVKNMFLEAELIGMVRPNSVVVPREAIHEGHVYVLTGNNRLEKRAVTIDCRQKNFVSIGKGLKAGETIVLSKLVPAIEGMLIKPVNDPLSLKFLLSEARSKGGKNEI